MSRFPKLSTGLHREFRNSYNEGVDLIEQDINKAVGDSTSALTKATNAETNASEAKLTAERVQTELGQAILEGDSSPLGGQLSVGADGTVYTGGPQERLVKEHDKVNALLAQTAWGVGKKNGDLSTILNEDGTVSVFTGDSLSYNRYGFDGVARTNAYDCYPGLLSWSFMLRDAIHRNDTFFKHMDELGVTLSNVTYAYNESADNSYLLPFNGRYLRFSAVNASAHEVSFPYRHYNKKTNKAYLYMSHNPNDSACSFDVYVDDAFVKTVNNNGAGKLYQGFEPFVVELPNLVAGNEYKISIKNLVQTASVPASDGKRTVYLHGVGSKFSPVHLTGRGSQTSQWLVDNLQEKVLNYNPDVVFITIGANDIILSDLSTYEANLENILSRIKTADVNTHIVLISPPRSASYTNETLQTFIEVMEKKATEYEAYFVNSYELFKKYPTSKWRADTIHYNRFGNTVLARTLLDVIMPSAVNDKKMIDSELYLAIGKMYITPPEPKAPTSNIKRGTTYAAWNGTAFALSLFFKSDSIVTSVAKINDSTIRVSFNVPIQTSFERIPICQQFGTTPSKLLHTVPTGVDYNNNTVDFVLWKVDGTKTVLADWETTSFKFMITY